MAYATSSATDLYGTFELATSTLGIRVTSEIGATAYAFGSALVLAVLILAVSAFALLIKRRKEI